MLPAFILVICNSSAQIHQSDLAGSCSITDKLPRVNTSEEIKALEKARLFLESILGYLTYLGVIFLSKVIYGYRI